MKLKYVFVSESVSEILIKYSSAPFGQIWPTLFFPSPFWAFWPEFRPPSDAERAHQSPSESNDVQIGTSSHLIYYLLYWNYQLWIYNSGLSNFTTALCLQDLGC